MLTPPHLDLKKIIVCLHDVYDIDVDTISFLPLGADFNTAVYKVVSHNKIAYFLKLRSAVFNENSVLVPAYLYTGGMHEIIPPFATQAGTLYTHLANFVAILYPYVEGTNAGELPLSEKQWFTFGTSLKKLHTTNIPLALRATIPQETFSDTNRELLLDALNQIEHNNFTDTIAQEMKLFLTDKYLEIRTIISRTMQLAQIVQQQSLTHVVCHADIHAWNLLIDKNDILYIVDWDTLVQAPKERDLMFIGAGTSKNNRSPEQEAALFYAGYGTTEINYAALAYYRYERIIQDIAEYCQHIFFSHDGHQERKQSSVYLRANFLPDGTLQMAYQADQHNKNF